VLQLDWAEMPTRPRIAGTAEHLDDLLAGLEVRLTDEVLDRIDEIVPPGTDVGTLDQAFVPASPVICSVMRSGSRQHSMPLSTTRRSSSGSDRTSQPFAYSTSKT
jgi:hypothetical protein